MKRLWIAAVVAAGCAPAATPPPAVETAPMKAAPAPEPPPEPAAPAEFRIARPTLADAPGRVRVRQIVRGGLGASFAPDGATMLVVRGRGGLILREGGKPRALPGRHFVSSRFAPDGAHVALGDEKRRLTLVAVATGKVVAVVDGAEKPRWVGPSTLRFLRGCAVMEVGVGGKPRAVGSLPRPCKKVVATSDDGNRWWLAEAGRYRRGVIQTYRRLVVHDVSTGATEVVLDGTDDAHFMEPQVSADGRRVCVLDAQFDLRCGTGDGVSERVWPNVRRPVVLHDSGRWLLFAVGRHTSADSQIGVADLEQRTITLLPRAGRQWWSFLDDGDRIAGHGGSSSALVYDLAAGWRSDVGDPGSEWEGLYPAPGDSSRFVVGRERGGSRDLYLATIPR